MARPLLLSRSMTTRARRLRARGFTLVELAVVVVIVGVLSVIAVVGYRKIIQAGKISEATNVIGAIRIAQHDFNGEKQTYADIGTSKYCPQNQSAIPDGTQKTQWSIQCNGGAANWDRLAVHVSDPVLFGYQTSAGVDFTANPISRASWVGTSAMPAKGPWYVIYATCDVTPGTPETEFFTTNATNRIFSRNEGE
jgi:prepilin-type N-terminal cleavage/methylation domain-containing protein